MKKKATKVMTGILIAAMISLAVAGCGVSEQDEKTTDNYKQEEKSETSKKKTRDDVVIYSALVPETLDQHDSVTVATAIYVRNLYANLYRFDTDGDITPELAESYSVNDDYTEYTITLKDGIQFSDGSPITEDDVAYTYRRGMNSEVTYYEELKDVEAKECMTASAYPEGFDMTIKVSDDERAKVVKEIGTLLSEIGIHVTAEKEDISQLLSEVTEHSYEAAIISYSMSSGTVAHAAPLFNPGDSLNFAASTDGEIADLLGKASSVKPEEKTEILSKAYQLMKEKNIYIGLYWPTVYDAKNVKLKQKAMVTSEKFIIANMYWE